MLLSKSCEYAIRAAIYIAKKSHAQQKTGIIEVSEEIASPRHFTGKILQTLVREKVLSSAKGPSGGFYIEPNRTVNLIDIIRAIDGDVLFTSCGLGLKKCSEKKPCPMHNQMLEIRTQLLKLFSKSSVNELVEGFDLNHSFLK